MHQEVFFYFHVVIDLPRQASFALFGNIDRIFVGWRGTRAGHDDRGLFVFHSERKRGHAFVSSRVKLVLPAQFGYFSLHSTRNVGGRLNTSQ